MKKTLRIAVVWAALLLVALLFSSCITLTKTEESEDKASTAATEATEPETEAKPETEPATEPETEPATEPETEAESGLKEFSFHGVVMDIPADFKNATNDTNPMLVPATYPYPSDNVTFVAGHDKVKDYTEEGVKAQLEAAFSASLGVEVEDYEYEKNQVAGVDYVIITYDFTYQDVLMYQCGITFFFEDESVSITFTDVSGEYEDAFNDMIASIRFE